MHIFRWLLPLLATLVLSAAARESGALSVADYTHGTGSYSPATGDYSRVSVGSHLDRHTLRGNVATSPRVNPLVFDFLLAAPQETVGANGDTLLFSGTGQVELIPLDATYTTFLRSGRVTSWSWAERVDWPAQPADDPLHAVALNDPLTFLDPKWSFSWELTGRIVLR